MFPQAIVEGKVIFRESLNVREVLKQFLRALVKRCLWICCLRIDTVKVGFKKKSITLIVKINIFLKLRNV